MWVLIANAVVLVANAVLIVITANAVLIVITGIRSEQLRRADLEARRARANVGSES